MTTQLSSAGIDYFIIAERSMGQSCSRVLNFKQGGLCKGRFHLIMNKSMLSVELSSACSVELAASENREPPAIDALVQRLDSSLFGLMGKRFPHRTLGYSHTEP